MTAVITVKWKDSVQKNHHRVIVGLSEIRTYDDDYLEALAADEAAARALVRAQALIAKVALWLWSDLERARDERRYDGGGTHWCNNCAMWASGFGEQPDHTDPLDYPNIDPLAVVCIHSKERDMWVERARDYVSRLIADTLDPQLLVKRNLDGLRAQDRFYPVEEPAQLPTHGTQPAGNTPAPAYYHPAEAEAQPDETELARRRDTAARGKAAALAALREPPDWDDLPIPIPALPTDYEQANA